MVTLCTFLTVKCHLKTVRKVKHVLPQKYLNSLCSIYIFDFMVVLQVLALSWSFEDIGMHEMMWSQLGDVTSHKPHLAAVSEGSFCQPVKTYLSSKH